MCFYLIYFYRECPSAQGKEAHNQSGLKDFMRHYNYDDESGLTYPALTGQRKQSVQDAENLFSEGVELFMRRV